MSTDPGKTQPAPWAIRAAQLIQQQMQQAVDERGIEKALYFAAEYFSQLTMAEIIERASPVAELIAALDVITRAYVRGADLSGDELRGAILRGADPIATLRVFTGLYRYPVWAFVSTAGMPWVRMGCFYRTVEEWDKIGIRNSNLSEFPDDGSEASEDRARAFEFAKAAALRDAAKVKREVKL